MFHFEQDMLQSGIMPVLGIYYSISTWHHFFMHLIVPNFHVIMLSKSLSHISDLSKNMVKEILNHFGLHHFKKFTCGYLVFKINKRLVVLIHHLLYILSKSTQ